MESQIYKTGCQNNRLKKWFKAASAMLLVVMLSSCYLPLRFDIEIDFSRRGFYTMTFIGFMTKVDLFQKIQQKKLTPAEVDEKLKVIETDFKRTSNTKEFSVFDRKRGIFKVKWVKTGDIIKDKMVTFIRRNEAMLMIIYNKKKNLVTIQGASIGKSNKKRLLNMGLDSTGVLKVKTDARILNSNANSERKRSDGKRGKEFTWNITTILAPKPVLTIDFR